MSKASHSPLGQWRGKTGGQVYRIRNGQQIVSAYQPVVANPKTDAQLMQRTRFNLMTKLNGLFDTRLLNGFSTSKGIARAMFSKKIMPYIYAQQLLGPGERKYRANIAPENIVFGPNAKNFIKPTETLASHVALTAPGTQARLTFTNLSALFDVDDTKAKIRFVDVFGSSVYGYSEVMVDAIDGTIIEGVPATLDFEGVGWHRIYMQVLAPNDSTLNNFRGESVVNEGDLGDDVVADAGASYASAFTVGGSVYIGSIEVTSV